MSQTFDEARIIADSYAKSERKRKRNAYVFLGLAIASAVVSLLISPVLVIPSLIFSALCYVGVQYGQNIWTQTKHSWLNWRAHHRSPSKNISMEALLPASSPQELLEVANVQLNQALDAKTNKIKHYESKATLKEDEPLSYYDVKHRRALFQYKMIQSTKESALRGRGEFITQMEDEKTSRRKLKIQILEILNEFIGPKYLSLCLKYNPETESGICTLGGLQDHQSAFLTKVKQLNNEAIYPLLNLPADQTKASRALLESLLPLVIDMEHVVSHLKPLGEIITLSERKYSINEEVIGARIQRLTREEREVLFELKV